MTHEELINRAKELQELDSNPDIATYQDIDNLPKGRVVVPWGPGSGKSTAIRNWIAKYWSSYCVYATHTIDEATEFYNDLMAMKEVGLIPEQCSISLFHKDTKTTTKQLQASNVVVCTHERLLIEPPAILYQTDLADPMMLNKNYKPIRSHIFIDELPDGYKSFKLTKDVLMSYLSLNDYLERNKDRKFDIGTKYQLVSHFYSQAYDDMISKLSTPRLPLKDSLLASSLMDHFSSMNLSIKPRKNHKKDIINRATYFSLLILDKIMDLIANSPAQGPDLVDSLVGSTVYYSILDIPESVDNIYIFDGTGDISFESSSYWTVANCDKFKRSISLNKYPQIIPESSLIRNEKTKEDSESNISSIATISSSISKMLDADPNSKVLIYSWKSLGLYDQNSNTEVELSNNLLERVSKSLKDYSNRISTIYYQSGKDRGTNEFNDYDTIVILGKFRIPSSAISLINSVRGTQSSNWNLLESLIIQAIARTRLRVGNSINVYFNSDFSPKDIKRILLRYDTCYIDNQLTEVKSIITEDDWDELRNNSSDTQKLLIDWMQDSSNGVSVHAALGKEVEFLSTEIAEICHTRPDNVTRMLDRCDLLEYRKVPGTSKTNPTKFYVKLKHGLFEELFK